MAVQVPIVKVYYGTPMLPDVSRVLACLCEKDVKFDLVDMYQGQQMNPNLIRFQASQTHVLGFEDEGKHLFESRKISRHIVNKYTDRGNKYLLGRDMLDRASIEQWLKSEEHSFDPPSYALIFNLAFGFEPDRTIIPESERRLSKILDVYEQRLGESRFLAGDEFSLADLSHLPNSHYLSKSDKWGHLFDSRKNVKKWCNEISSRNSWQEVVKILDEHGIGGKKVGMNSKDGYRFLNKKQLELKLPKDGSEDDSNMSVIKIREGEKDRSNVDMKQENATAISIDRKNIADTQSATKTTDSGIRKEPEQTYDQTSAKNSDKNKDSDGQYNSEENKRLNGEKTDKATESGVHGPSSSKPTQEKTEKASTPQQSTDSTVPAKSTGGNQEESNQKGKNEASQMKLREKEESGTQLKVKKDDETPQKPNSESKKSTEKTTESTEEVVNKAKPPAPIQNGTSGIGKQDQDADKTGNKPPPKSPTVQPKPNGDGKEKQNAGEVDLKTKLKENKDQNGPKEESKEIPADAKQQEKTPAMSNQKENKINNVSGDIGVKEKDDSQRSVPKKNDTQEKTEKASIPQQTTDSTVPATDSTEEVANKAKPPPPIQNGTSDIGKQGQYADKTGNEVKRKDDSQKTVAENNEKAKTPAESPEKLKDDKQGQENKQESGPDTNDIGDLNKQSGTST